MHAMIEWVGSLVAALAVAAFSHFGVSVKDSPERAQLAVVRKVPAAAAAQPVPVRRQPCPDSERARPV